MKEEGHGSIRKCLGATFLTVYFAARVFKVGKLVGVRTIHLHTNFIFTFQIVFRENMMKRSISIVIGLILLAGLVWGVMAGRETAVVAASGEKIVTTSSRDWECWDDGTVDPYHTYFHATDFFLLTMAGPWVETHYCTGMALTGYAFLFQILIAASMTGLKRRILIW
jgi:hypothetical protein